MIECIRKDFPPEANSCEGVNYSKPFDQWDCKYCAGKASDEWTRTFKQMAENYEKYWLKKGDETLKYHDEIYGTTYTIPIKPKKWWQWWR